MSEHVSASVQVIGLTSRQVTFAKVRGRSLIQSAKTELGLTLAVELLVTDRLAIWINGRLDFPRLSKAKPRPKTACASQLFCLFQWIRFWYMFHLK